MQRNYARLATRFGATSDAAPFAAPPPAHKPIVAVIGHLSGMDPAAVLAFDFDVRAVAGDDIDMCAEAILLLLQATDACRAVRRIRSQTALPLVALLGTDDVHERAHALESGADDIVPQPHDPLELLARLRAVLRRSGRSGADVIRIRDLEISARDRSARRAKKFVMLTPNEHAILRALVQCDDGLSRHTLAERVWGGGDRVNDATIDTTVSHLRSKLRELGAAPALRSVRGYGYRFEPHRLAVFSFAKASRNAGVTSSRTLRSKERLRP